MTLIKRNKLPVLVALVYALIFAVAPQKALQSAHNSVYYLMEMLQVLPVIFLLTVVIEAWVPKELIMRGFGEKSGFKGNLLSLLLGSVSAGPIYAAFPVCKALLQKGASITNIVIILSAWAVIKVPMLANEAKFLGPKFMVIRWILTVIAIFVMAHLMQIVVKKEDLPGLEPQESTAPTIRTEYCIGCGVCARMSPELFEIKGRKALIKMQSVDAASAEAMAKAVQQCPAKAIIFDPAYVGSTSPLAAV